MLKFDDLSDYFSLYTGGFRNNTENCPTVKLVHCYGDVIQISQQMCFLICFVLMSYSNSTFIRLNFYLRTDSKVHNTKMQISLS